jgi:hypothetical protein
MSESFKDEIRDRMDAASQTEREVFDRAGRLAQGSTTLRSGVRAAEEDLNESGYTLISADTDSTRAVYRNDDLVVKFEPLDTWRNENEAMNWRKRLPESAKRLFSPVRAVGDDYLLVLMDYAEVDAVTDAQHRELLRALIVEENLDMTDPHPDNVGLLDGRAVMIDYNFRPKPVADDKKERVAAFEKKLRDYMISP